MISESEFKKITNYIKSHYGINIKEEKLSLITGRLGNLLTQNDIHNFSDYYDYVISDPTGNAATELINKITTNHTFFMREADHFEYFKNTVLPYWHKNIKDRDLRVWSAGCSTGEEPYTLAILLNEYFGSEKVLWDTRVLATDISSKALETAIKGIYSGEDLSVLPVSWRQNYFTPVDRQNFSVTSKLQNDVIFRRFNFMDHTFPFRKKIHVIFCRNVMIYFDNKTKCELVNKFYQSLEKGGYLFIGHSEALNREETQFKYIMPAVYRKE